MIRRHLQVSVKPNARRSVLTELVDGSWVAELKSPPVDGKANAELVGLVAAHFGCRRSPVTIMGGATGRHKRIRISAKSKTHRMVASCCNSAMVIRFADSRPWVSVFRQRFRGEAPPLELRIMTKFNRASTELPDDLSSYRSYPLWLPARLVSTKIAMLLGR